MPDSPLYGGQRARAIRSSLYNHLSAGLTALGWFGTGGNFTPVTFIDEIPQFESNKAIAPNTLAIVDGHSMSVDMELGLDNGEHHLGYSVELYAENDSVGLAIIKDVESILEGRNPNANAFRPIIILNNYATATPVSIGYMDVEKVESIRMSGPQPWMRYWYVCTFELVDFSSY